MEAKAVLQQEGAGPRGVGLGAVQGLVKGDVLPLLLQGLGGISGDEGLGGISGGEGIFQVVFLFGMPAEDEGG